jgi:choline transport protein
MVSAILIGTVTGFVFLLSLLFCVTDYQDLLVNPAGALLTVYYQATGNRIGASCLQVISIGCQLWAVTGAVTTAGRMTWSFARDGGLPGSRLIAKVMPGLDVPFVALVVGAFIPIAYVSLF